MAISGGKFEDQNVKKNVGSEDSPHGSAKKKKKPLSIGQEIFCFILLQRISPLCSRSLKRLNSKVVN